MPHSSTVSAWHLTQSKIEREFQERISQRRERDHQRRMKRISARIHTKPKPIRLSAVFNYRQLFDDRIEFERRKACNTKLYETINRLQYLTLTYKTFPKYLYIASDFARLAHLRLTQIEKRNRQLAKKIIDAVPLTCIHLRRYTRKLRKSRRSTVTSLDAEEQIRESMDLKLDTYIKYAYMNLPIEQHMLGTLLRPKVYFDFAVLHRRPLGRIVVQLFTEACPEVVLEFVKLCTNKQLDLLHIIRIFPNLWVEAELDFGKQCELRYPGFDYETAALDHRKGPGVFSFCKDFLNGFRHGFINFAIGFRPLAILKGERIPFGIVKEGQRVLACMEDFGTKNGKVRETIVVKKCGRVDN